MYLINRYILRIESIYLFHTHGVKKTVIEVKKCWAEECKDGRENITLPLHDEMTFLKSGKTKQYESHNRQVIKIETVLFSKRRKK